MPTARRFWMSETPAQQWTPARCVIDADGMRAEHGSEKAASMAAVYRTAYHPGTMGALHWRLIHELLAGAIAASDVIALPEPLRGWPHGPYALVQAPAIMPRATIPPGPGITFELVDVPTQQRAALTKLVEEHSRDAAERISRTYTDGRPAPKSKRDSDDSQGSLF